MKKKTVSNEFVEQSTTQDRLFEKFIVSYPHLQTGMRTTIKGESCNPLYPLQKHQT